MKMFINKYLTQKNRNVLSICVIVFGLLFIYNYTICINHSYKHIYTTNSVKLTKNKNIVTRLNVTENDTISLTSNKYQITEDYVYYGTDSLSNVKSNITCTNCSLNVRNNKLEVSYNGNIVKTYDLVGISSTKYDLTKDYIFDYDSNMVHDITCTNCILNVNNNKLEIKYNDNTIDTYDLISLTTKDYLLLDNYIYHGFKKTIDVNKIKCINCTPTIDNNKLTIKYNNSIVKEYTFLGLSTEYKIINKTIYVLLDYGDDEAIINKINRGICTLDIQSNNLLLVKYNNNIIDSYHLGIDEDIAFAQDYIIDEERMILYKVDSSLSVNEFLSKIETTGTTNVLDINNNPVNDKLCTGYTLKITFEDDPDNLVEYKLSVRGDVLGTGELSIDNGKMIAKHIINKNAIKGEEYLLAADYNGDGAIKMNDVMMILNNMNKQN